MLDDEASQADAQIDLSRSGDFRLGGLQVRPSALEIEGGGRRRILQPRMMQVLVALARRKGEVVSREQLIWSCWGGLSVSNDAIDRCIAKLRRLAADDGAPCFDIETVPRIGYRLSDVAPDPPVVRGGRPARSRTLLTVALGLGALALALAAGLGVVLPQLRLDRARAARDVAVLPFEGADASLRQSLAEDVVRALTLSGSTPRAEGAAHAASGLSIGGEVSRDGEGVLGRIRVDDDRAKVTLWAGQVAGSDRSVLTEAAARAADAVQYARLCQPAQPAARSLCVQTGELLRANDFANARILAERLTAEAPRLGAGQLLLASAAVGETLLPQGGGRQERLAQAGRAARRALELDGALSDAWRVLAQTLPKRDWSDREALLRRAQANGAKTTPMFEANADNAMARLLIDAGRPQDAAAYAQRASTLDPLSPAKAITAASALEAEGRLAPARALVDDLSRTWPRDGAVRLYRRNFLLLYGSQAEALAALDNGPFVLEPSARQALEAFLSARGRPGPASRQAAVEALLRVVQAGLLDSRLVIAALASLGETGAAFAVADRYFSDPYVETTVLFSPATARMRRDPRFLTLAARTGLTDYWRASGTWPAFCADRGLPYDCRRPAWP